VQEKKSNCLLKKKEMPTPKWDLAIDPSGNLYLVSVDKWQVLKYDTSGKKSLNRNFKRASLERETY